MSPRSHLLHKGKKEIKVLALHKAALTAESEVLGRCAARITKIPILILIKTLFLRRRENMPNRSSSVQHTPEKEREYQENYPLEDYQTTKII